MKEHLKYAVIIVALDIWLIAQRLAMVPVVPMALVLVLTWPVVVRHWLPSCAVSLVWLLFAFKALSVPRLFISLRALWISSVPVYFFAIPLLITHLVRAGRYFQSVLWLLLFIAVLPGLLDDLWKNSPSAEALVGWRHYVELAMGLEPSPEQASVANRAPPVDLSDVRGRLKRLYHDDLGDMYVFCLTSASALVMMFAVLAWPQMRVVEILWRCPVLIICLAVVFIRVTLTRLRLGARPEWEDYSLTDNDHALPFTWLT